MKSFLIIQTAYLGDVILATPVVEKLKAHFPEAKIDFLLRKGNESLLENHPHINEILIWDKSENKKKNLFKLSKKVRKRNYECVINLHRFTSSGFITMRSGAKIKLGFEKSPFSFTYNQSFKHAIGKGTHEIDRNLSVISQITDSQQYLPKLYPSKLAFEKTEEYKTGEYICIAPTSVWYTKQLPDDKWIELINRIDQKNVTTYLIGGPEDRAACGSMKSRTLNDNVINLAGKLSILESAALMRDAKMNYVNDSAPLHLASAIDAPVTVFYCSTVPDFGFGPLSGNATIIQTTEELKCRPCGLHGFKDCPKKHFKCGLSIDTKSLI